MRVKPTRLIDITSGFLLLLLSTTMTAAAASAGTSSFEKYQPSTWYQKYDAYPPYCATPAEMKLRQIPGLREKDHLIGETRLVHLTAVIRHGARTPWSSNERCWEDYWNASKDTSRWDCALTTVMAPPDPNTVSQEEGDSTSWLPDDAFFLYEKVYDALNSADDGALKNELNGSCQVGQMLLQGYEQQIENGKILRQAYGYLENDYSHDERMRLFDLTYDGSTSGNNVNQRKLPWDKNHLYFRADDDQRTVMSGQVLLRGLFDTEVTEKFMDDGTYPNVLLHIADRERDVLGANTLTCPRLKELQNAAFQSQEYQAFNNSDQLNSLRWFAKDKLGASDGVNLLDCLMTTICTDRELPDAVNDFGSTGIDGSMFEALAEAEITSYSLKIKYNNSDYAKLAMGPLWAEIMDNINPFLKETDSSGDTPAPKFALFSGHDTTVMPLLASLDPGLWNSTEWAPYASMMLIEIHELIDGISNKDVYRTNFAFRLLFNGKILTSLVPGCPPSAELCDAAILKSLVDPIATRNPDCSLRIPVPVTPSASLSSKEAIVKAHALLSTRTGIMMFVGLVVFGILVGAMGTYVLLTRRRRWSAHHSLVTNDDEDAQLGLRESSNYCDDELSEEGEQEFADAARR